MIEIIISPAGEIKGKIDTTIFRIYKLHEDRHHRGIISFNRVLSNGTGAFYDVSAEEINLECFRTFLDYFTHTLESSFLAERTLETAIGGRYFSMAEIDEGSDTPLVKFRDLLDRHKNWVTAYCILSLGFSFPIMEVFAKVINDFGMQGTLKDERVFLS